MPQRVCMTRKGSQCLIMIVMLQREQTFHLGTDFILNITLALALSLTQALTW